MPPKEAVAKQHKLMMCKVKVKMKGRQRQERFKRTRWWKLNEEEHRNTEEVCEGNERKVGTGGMVLGGDEYEDEGRGKRCWGVTLVRLGKKRRPGYVPSKTDEKRCRAGAVR